MIDTQPAALPSAAFTRTGLRVWWVAGPAWAVITGVVTRLAAPARQVRKLDGKLFCWLGGDGAARGRVQSRALLLHTISVCEYSLVAIQQQQQRCVLSTRI